VECRSRLFLTCDIATMQVVQGTEK